MVMVGLSVVPVVIVFVEWLITHKIWISKYVVDMTVCTTAVLAGRIPFSLTRSTAEVTMFFRDLLMETTVGILNPLYWSYNMPSKVHDGRQ